MIGKTLIPNSEKALALRKAHDDIKELFGNAKTYAITDENYSMIEDMETRFFELFGETEILLTDIPKLEPNYGGILISKINEIIGRKPIDVEVPNNSIAKPFTEGFKAGHSYFISTNPCSIVNISRFLNKNNNE